MYVQVNIPEIPDDSAGFANYWLDLFFSKAPSDRYQINALTSTYVRLVEASLIEYRLGAEKLREFWNTHSSLNLGAMHRSMSHFESCISNMYRAINCFRRLRNDRERDPLAILLSTSKVEFAKDSVTEKFRLVRNEIHHLEEAVIHGRIASGQPFALKPDGPEVPHPTEMNQTIKSVDRLVIGEREVTFSKLAKSLTEMSDVVLCISEHLSNTVKDHIQKNVNVVWQ
jgi:hypothetical protein